NQPELFQGFLVFPSAQQEMVAAAHSDYPVAVEPADAALNQRCGTVHLHIVLRNVFRSGRLRAVLAWHSDVAAGGSPTFWQNSRAVSKGRTGSVKRPESVTLRS